MKSFRISIRKRIYISFSLLFVLSAFQQKEQEKVYICVSIKSERYHYNKECRGLSGCKSKVKMITKKKAERFGRILCKIERKKN